MFYNLSCDSCILQVIRPKKQKSAVKNKYDEINQSKLFLLLFLNLFV